MPHIGPFEFFAQPVTIHVDDGVVTGRQTCDAGSVSGGTLHTFQETGFLATFAACKVNGSTRVLWLTPQAINANVRGTVSMINGTLTASVNYEDVDVAQALVADVARATRDVFGHEVNIQSVSRLAPAYHWTGTRATSFRSRVTGIEGAYLADALGISGTTRGWTSFNARVSGALAALRASRMLSDVCATLQNDFSSESCCTTTTQQCRELRAEHRRHGCCGA